MARGKRRMRQPSQDRPLVYYLDVWLRSGHPSRYDAWPVLNPLNEYQERLTRTR